MIKLLSKKDLEKKCKRAPEWVLNKKQTELSRTFFCSSFLSALSFVTKIAVHAEVMSHHPDIELSYGKVKVTVTTHDSSGLTKLDFELAEKIDNLRL